MISRTSSCAEGKTELHNRSPLTIFADGALATNTLQTLMHIVQPLTGSRSRPVDGQTGAIVLHSQDQSMVFHAGAHPKFIGAGMFYGIIHGLLEREKQIMAHLGTQRRIRQIFGKFQPAPQWGVTAEIFGEVPDIA